MIRALQRCVATLVASLGLALPAAATTFSTDWTDLWFNAAESGWGVNLIQQGDIIFATLFVYGQDNTPRWYVASNLSPVGGSTTAFSGQLFQTTGPFFGAPWTGGAQPTAVGTMTLSFATVGTGTLTYSVNGVNVTKAIERQTWRFNVVSGTHLGGMSAIASACTVAGDNGPANLFGFLNATHNGGTQITFTVDPNSLTPNPTSRCLFTGTYAQAGKQGSVTNGTFSCTLNGQASNTGTFTLSQLDVTRNGFTSAFTGKDQFCTYNGYFGGLKDVL